MDQIRISKGFFLWDFFSKCVATIQFVLAYCLILITRLPTKPPGTMKCGKTLIRTNELEEKEKKYSTEVNKTIQNVDHLGFLM